MKSHICILASLTFTALLISACASKRQHEVASSQPITAVVTNSIAPVVMNAPIVISNTSATNLPAQKATNAPLLVIIMPTNASPAYVSNLIATTSLPELYNAYEHGLIGKGVMMQAVLMSQNGQPLDFYGKIIDQNGDPVVGATVEGGILLNKDFVHSASEAHYTTTDSGGYFHFLGVHGVRMGIRPKKNGYEYNYKLPSERLGNYRPDPNNPVVFTMWKLKGAEPMVHSQIEVGIPCDGTQQQFDLLTGRRVASGGDLTVSFERNPVDIIRGKHFGWKLVLNMSQGGLIQATDKYQNAAPENGYKPDNTIDMPADIKGWTASFRDTYYFEGRGGNVFGRVTVHLTGDYEPPPTHFEIDAYINPAGSRNLEIDPTKLTRVGNGKF